MLARIFHAYERSRALTEDAAMLAWVAVGGVSIWIARKVSRDH